MWKEFETMILFVFIQSGVVEFVSMESDVKVKIFFFNRCWQTFGGGMGWGKMGCPIINLQIYK